MATVFISYSHLDSEVADRIGDALSAQGVDFFRDMKDIDWGKSINSEVRLGIVQAPALLVILSPASLKSAWVPYEVGYACALGKRILPFLTHPSLDVPDYIRDLKYLTEIVEIEEYFSGDVITELGDSEALPAASSLGTEGPAVRFRKAQAMMPELFAQMIQDVSGDETGLVRELFLSPRQSTVLRGRKRRFRYNEDQHQDLVNKIDILEDYGLVWRVGSGAVYRMSEEFLDLLRHAAEAA